MKGNGERTREVSECAKPMVVAVFCSSFFARESSPMFISSRGAGGSAIITPRLRSTRLTATSFDTSARCSSRTNPGSG